MSEPLPPRSSNNKEKERVFRTSLKASYFVQLEQEASERGMTAYKLSSSILSMYVTGKLIVNEQSTGEQ